MTDIGHGGCLKAGTYSPPLVPSLSGEWAGADERPPEISSSTDGCDRVTANNVTGTIIIISGQHWSTQRVYLFCLSIFSDTRQCASNKTIKVPSYNDPEAGFERLHDKCQDVRRVMVIPRKLFRDQKNPDQWKLDIPGQPHSKDIEDFPQRLQTSTVPLCKRAR